MRKVRVIATKTQECNLKPGDLYSTKGPEYWNRAMKGNVLAQALIVPNDVQFESNDEIFRLTIVVSDADGKFERNQFLIAEAFDPFAPPGVSYGEYGSKVK